MSHYFVLLFILGVKLDEFNFICDATFYVVGHTLIHSLFKLNYIASCVFRTFFSLLKRPVRNLSNFMLYSRPRFLKINVALLNLVNQTHHIEFIRYFAFPC